jgi:hypothetical protein
MGKWKRSSFDVEKEIQETRPYISIDHSTYIDTQHKCRFIDSKYGEFWREPNYILRGNNHPLRAKEIWDSKRRISSYELEKEIQKDRPYISIKHETFTNMLNKCTFIDKDFGEWVTYPSAVKNGKGHRKRDAYNKSKKMSTSFSEAQKRLSEYDPKLKIIEETYVNFRKPCTIIHEDYGPWVVSLSNIFNLKQNHPRLKQGYKIENEIFDWLRSLDLNVEKNTRKWSSESRSEIDFLLKDLNIGIEYCGLYWHTEEALTKYKKNAKLSHYEKMKLAEKEGIRLITIFEHEWLNRKDQVKNFLISVFNKNSIRIRASKCSVLEIPKKEASKFLDENHIQGSRKQSKVAYGLYYNNELVGVITGGLHHRDNTKFILDRLCFKTNYTVYGGSSKLLNKLIEYAKNNGFDKIISWSDNRWSNGKVYNKLGFIKENELFPDYQYVKDHKVISKQKLKLSKEEKKLNLTERELRKKQGYKRIWDCGKIKWVYHL